jgi:thioredoxin-dependent peroxiredoxin
MLADADHAVAEACGTWVEKKSYGKQHWGVQRGTFIVRGRQDRARDFECSPKTHDDEVLAALAQLRAT